MLAEPIQSQAIQTLPRRQRRSRITTLKLITRPRPHRRRTTTQPTLVPPIEPTFGPDRFGRPKPILVLCTPPIRTVTFYVKTVQIDASQRPPITTRLTALRKVITGTPRFLNGADNPSGMAIRRLGPMRNARQRSPRTSTAPSLAVTRSRHTQPKSTP